jgi:hypothetical protein
MNVLGQRTGVGGAWKDVDEKSPSLRQRAIQLACKDVKVSLMTCCGMSALYGLSAVAIGVATGIQPSPDMAGGKLDPNSPSFDITLRENNLDPSTIKQSFLPTPPLTLLIDQKLVENSSWTNDGDRVKQSFAQQELFGICCSVNESQGIVLYGSEIDVKLESPSSLPIQTGLRLTKFVSTDGDVVTNDEPPPSKRTKLDNPTAATSTQDLMDEVEVFASILSETLDMDAVTAAADAGLNDPTDESVLGAAVATDM